MNALTFSLNGKEFKPYKRRGTYYFEYPCTNPTICYPIETTLLPGIYHFELWGAQGGSDGSHYGGRGGYSSGILRLQEHVKAFLYIGAEGTNSRDDDRFTSYSFNGGGKGRGDSVRNATSGGGGTDIRLLEDSLYHRIIVAGGGGGSNEAYNDCYGGSGGGEEGIAGTACDIKSRQSSPGTQEAGGKTPVNGVNGAFGLGGNKTGGDGCGGGGGWYGGGATEGYISAGSGGSGFIFNQSNYETAIKAKLLLPPHFFLENGFMITGNQTMPSSSPYSPNEIGHSGNGAIVITLLINGLINTCNPKVLKLQFYLLILIFILYNSIWKLI